MPVELCTFHFIFKGFFQPNLANYSKLGKEQTLEFLCNDLNDSLTSVYCNQEHKIRVNRKVHSIYKVRKNKFWMRIGGGWTRTNVVVRRGIYSPLQLPLCDTPEEWEKMLAKGIEPSTL